jgi:pimeloyl-ACP methyl ester carboxylesterase
MEIKVIKGAGHWVQAEQPQLFLDVVNSFLKE